MWRRIKRRLWECGVQLKKRQYVREKGEKPMIKIWRKWCNRDNRSEDRLSVWLISCVQEGWGKAVAGFPLVAHSLNIEVRLHHLRSLPRSRPRLLAPHSCYGLPQSVPHTLPLPTLCLLAARWSIDRSWPSFVGDSWHQNIAVTLNRELESVFCSDIDPCLSARSVFVIIYLFYYVIFFLCLADFWS